MDANDWYNIDNLNSIIIDNDNLYRKFIEKEYRSRDLNNYLNHYTKIWQPEVSEHSTKEFENCTEIANAIKHIWNSNDIQELIHIFMIILLNIL